MAKGFTPIIGLAVVVALALAAVFGAMSLANPAWAQAEPATTVEAYVGDTDPIEVNIIPHLNGREDDFSGFGTITFTGPIGEDTADTNALGIATSNAFGVIGVTVTPASDAEVGSYHVTIPAQFDTGRFMDVILGVDILAATPATAVGTISEYRVAIAFDEQDPPVRENGDPITVRLENYFADGKGTGSSITTYTTSVEIASSGAPAGGLTATVPGTDDASTTVDETETVNLVAVAAARVGDSYRVTVTGEDEIDAADDPTQSFYVDIVGADATSGSVGVTTPGVDGDLPSFEADTTTPGSVARYEFEFSIEDETNTLINDLVIELEDFSVPSGIGSSSVTIETGVYTFTPEDVAVDGEEIFISIGDVTEDTGADQGGGVYVVGGSGETMTVVFRKSAGISNPTEAGTFGANITFGALEYNYEDLGEPDSLDIPVVRKISTDEEDGGLGTVVTATGKGYKNGTSLTVFVDRLIPVMWNVLDDGEGMIPLPYDMVSAYDLLVEEEPDRGNIPEGDIPADDGEAMHTYVDDGEMFALAPNRRLDLGEDQLCVVDKIGGNDVGKCEFTVSHPTFDGGLNYINAVDGRNGYAPSPDTFELTASIQASPSGGSPGEIILVQVVDFTRNAEIDKVQIGRQNYCGDDANPVGDTNACRGSVDSTGSGNFKITIPNWARAGVQELKVWDTNGESASTNVTLSGPQIQVTPQTILSNQRVSLVGVGFSSGAMIGDEDGSEQISEISIGGEVVPWSRVSGGADVDVDSGGNWSASVDLPFSEATTAEGERIIRVTDSGGRSGDVEVSVPARQVTITPDTGRVGTTATIRGSGFPSKNDEGSSFNVEIVYDAGNDKETTVSAVPDASGRFEVQLRIPTTASIPSTNTVKVTFEDDDDVAVVTTVAHEVPEGVISLSATSGGPGSTITIGGEGFKAFVPISSVGIGALDVTPAPKPSTDGNGMMSFDITIPGLDLGIQTIEVNVGRTTASTGFTVTASGVSAGDIKPSAEAVEELGDNFVRAFNFNNDTKTWTFYDPAAGDASTLQNFITGESYWILIKATQEAILNRETRNLTCVDGNCWNQVVW